MVDGASDAGTGAASLRARLAAAVDGLFFSSESDRPFGVFFRPASAVPRPLTAQAFAAIVGAQGDEPVEERPFERFLARHIDMVDPADATGWRLLPRYEALRVLLQSELTAPRFFRIGRVQVRCYAVGLDADGNLVGVETVAIET